MKPFDVYSVQRLDFLDERPVSRDVLLRRMNEEQPRVRGPINYVDGYMDLAFAETGEVLRVWVGSLGASRDRFVPESQLVS